MATQLSAEDLLRSVMVIGGAGLAGQMFRSQLARGRAFGGNGLSGALLSQVSMPGINGEAMRAGNLPMSGGGGDRITAGDIIRMKAKYGENSYPKRFYPNRYHTVNVDPYDGPGIANNDGCDKPLAQAAGHMQSIDEHNDTIFKYLRPGMTQTEAREALLRGMDDEEKLPAFWTDDKPRRDYHPNSSAVKAIRITPDNRIEVMWRAKPTKKNPTPVEKWYTFKSYENLHKASEEFGKLVSGNSIGQAVYPVLTRMSRDPKWKPKPGLGSFNTPNYDASMAV